MSAAVALLGGASRGSTRARGFAAWRPQRETLVLIEQVQAVLVEYRDHLPLTIRQVFYRLVGAHAFPKTELAYERLGEHLSRARRARLIPMQAIRDDGGGRYGGPGWSSVGAFLRSVRSTAAALRLDRTEGQPTRLMVMCEAAGMAPQLDRVLEHHDVSVISSGGFDSLTEKHRLAREISTEQRPVEVLHIGDHDPSGAHLFLALVEDVTAFVRDLGGEVTFSRLAVTPDQIHELTLSTAPPKPTDRRAFAGETCQAEAIAPDVLARIVLDAVESRIDMPTYQRVLAHESEERERLVRLIGMGLPEDRP